MSKNYNEISNQCVVFKTANRTFAVYPNIEVPSKERYGEGVTGKVKLMINDFSEGKGDKAKKCTFNLDIKDVFYLYEKAKMSHLPVPYRMTKIIGAKVENSGKFAGLSPVSRLSVSRIAKTASGEDVNYPWKIEIKNGYAKAMPGRVPGTYYEGRDTYRTDTESDMKFTDVDFLMVMAKIVEYVEYFKMIRVLPVFRAGLEEYEKADKEYRERGSYVSSNPTTPEPAPAETTCEPEPMQEKLDFTENVAPATPTPAPTTPEKRPDVHEMTMVISTPFQFLNDGEAVAGCTMGGKSYNVMFSEVSDILLEAQEKKSALKALLYQDENKKLRFFSLVA